MNKRLVGAVVVCLLLVGSYVVTAQVARPYRNGSVWDVGFIRVKPGMNEAYMAYLAGDWKRAQEALKSAGIILSYKVLQTEPHTPGDFTLMLMTEYKDLATMEANESKADAIMQQVREGQLDREQALALCLESGSAVANVFAGAVRKWGRPAVEVEQAILDAGERARVARALGDLDWRLLPLHSVNASPLPVVLPSASIPPVLRRGRRTSRRCPLRDSRGRGARHGPDSYSSS